MVVDRVEAISYRELNEMQRLQDRYGHVPEQGVWLFWRRVEQVDVNVAVKVEDGEVVGAEAWHMDRVKEFLQENPVEIRECAPDEVVSAAMEPPIEDLV